MFDWLIKLLGGVTRMDYDTTRSDYFDALLQAAHLERALNEIVDLDTPNAAHGVKKAVKIAKDALEVENE